MIDDIDLSSFSHGGMNITGFRIVDEMNTTVRNFLDGWENLTAKFWPGAGSRRISVSTQSLLLFTD